VSLESEADALRETARRELASANASVIEARLKADELRKQVQDEVENIRADAVAEANRTIAQAALKLADAAREHQMAEEVRRAAERALEEAQSTRLAHESAARDHGVAKVKHEISAQLHNEAKARLEAVARQIAEALK
jgi:F0F1-type ATP synthase membrane subunit b/b'